MSDRDDWQGRLKAEYRELDARISRLNEEIERITFRDTINRIALLDTVYGGDESVRTQLELLKLQGYAMEVYRFILWERAKLAGIEL